jgi:hypothetical protein
MSDSETTGWEKNGDILEKYIHSRSRWWTISDMPPPFTLRLNRTFIATRPTLHACQRLAHATARLWAGDTE